MSVVIETTIGSMTIDLYTDLRPRTCLNFLKLCKLKYYNFCPFHRIIKDFIAQSGEQIYRGRSGGQSIFQFLYGENGRYFEPEPKIKLKHDRFGTVSMVTSEAKLCGSQFFFTLSDSLDYLDDVHTVFGRVVEGLEVLHELNQLLCDQNDRPYKDVLITHTVVLHDPFDDPNELEFPDRSPEPDHELLNSDSIFVKEGYDENEGKSKEQIDEEMKDKDAKAKAIVLEMIGDLPDAEVAPPDNVLFVCKLNPVTRAEDLEVIFSRFGKITECEVICDQKTQESLQYAFIEFEKPEDCEKAYFKMDNVLIDDRRIHVDFSQSVAKFKWDRKLKEENKQQQEKQIRSNRSRSKSVDSNRPKYRRNDFQSQRETKRQFRPFSNDRRQYERNAFNRDQERATSKRTRSRSPRRNRSRSPKRYRSRTPKKHRSRSPRRKEARSPRRNRSRTPKKERLRSPKRYRSRSPRKERSPVDRYHKSKHGRSKDKSYRSRSRSYSRSKRK